MNPGRMSFKDLLLWLRVKFCLPLSLTYWIGPLVCGPGLGDWGGLLNYLCTPSLFIGWLATFSIITVGSLLNDARDFHADNQNPKKQNKPLQRGLIFPSLNIKVAWWMWLTALPIAIGLMIFNPIVIPVYLISLGMPFLYYYGKDVPPCDLIVDSLLLPLPIAAGFNMCGLNPPSGLMVGALGICFLAYLHDMIYDLAYDKKTTIKVLFGKGVMGSHLLLVGISLIFCIAEPSWAFLGMVLGYNAAFYHTLWSKNWPVYTYATILFPGMYLIVKVLELLGIHVSFLVSFI